jgi:hypothetical protein
MCPVAPMTMIRMAGWAGAGRLTVVKKSMQTSENTVPAPVYCRVLSELEDEVPE